MTRVRALGKGGGNTERRIARKRQKANENSVSGVGRTLTQILMDDLDQATKNYLDTCKELSDDEFPDKNLEMLQWEKRLRRGIMRGIAHGVAVIQSPYEVVKARKLIEKESVARVREN